MKDPDPLDGLHITLKIDEKKKVRNNKAKAGIKKP